MDRKKQGDHLIDLYKLLSKLSIYKSFLRYMNLKFQIFVSVNILWEKIWKTQFWKY